MSCLEHRRKLTQQPGEGCDFSLSGAFSTLWGDIRPYQRQEEMLCLSSPVHLHRVASRYLLLREANQGWHESPSDSLIIQRIAADWCCILQIFGSPQGSIALTWAPEGDALLLMGLADAVVAVPIHPMARVPVVQVNIGRALRAGPRAELGQVTRIARLSARNPRWFQLQNKQNLSACALAGSAMQHRSRFVCWPGPS